MSYLREKTKEESLQCLKSNLDENGTITDEFLASFAGVEKRNFNRRADQLIENGISIIYKKIITEKEKFTGLVVEKITRKYELYDVIIILSQYQNDYQIKALELCRIALISFFSLNKKSQKKKSTIQVPVYIDDLFGGSVISHYETKSISDLDYEEYTEAKIFHMGRVQEGLIKNISSLTQSLFDFKNDKIKALSEARPDFKVHHEPETQHDFDFEVDDGEEN